MAVGMTSPPSARPPWRACELYSALNTVLPAQSTGAASSEEIPPHVEYTLSEKGLALVPALQSICAWAAPDAESNAPWHDVRRPVEEFCEVL